MCAAVTEQLKAAAGSRRASWVNWQMGGNSSSSAVSDQLGREHPSSEILEVTFPSNFLLSMGPGV